MINASSPLHSRREAIRSIPVGSRVAASVLVVFFLVFEFTIPNPDFYVSEQVAPVLMPIANLINLNVMWQFFSPDPGGIVYLTAAIKKNDQIIANEEMPPKDHQFFLEDRYLRRSAIMRYMLNDFDRIKTILIPWYCRLYPEATTVEVTLDDYSFASFEEMREGRRHFNDRLDNEPKRIAAASCVTPGIAP